MGVVASAKFSARIWLRDDGVEEIKVWVPELYPVDSSGRRSSEEWIMEHLGEWSREQFIDLINCQDVPPSPLLGEGAFQLLIQAEIEGTRSFTMDGDEYDEDVQVDKVDWCRVPSEWFKDCEFASDE